MNELSIWQKGAFLFDLDGCIYHGDQAAAGAHELINLLRTINKKIRFITNNSSDNAIGIQTKLDQMGINVEETEIITTTDYIGHFLLEEYGLSKVKVIGSQTLKECIAKQGHTILDDFSREVSDVIVIGRDVSFTYQKLKMIVNEALHGANLIGTNPDMTHPGVNGELVPETGSLVAAVESMIGRKIQSFGKPAPYLFEYGMSSCHVSPKECVMFGDNFTTDMVGAIQLGMSAVWLTDRTEFHPNEAIDINGNAPKIISSLQLLVEKYDPVLVK
ncbi:HAD-IIA family hydrolase [Bacillus suaedae]|uniref:HAD-IIA family hydrolase n=1 Tax=Halalkalibacter suaedae TaxID=2822140 RepID=A0A941APG8_9BACI|nr:HAD-IIA family hydrolase [Bacillus suaedae]MBP3950098.1 HAD-IIA family hydrolase [Bacillus suaedae]